MNQFAQLYPSSGNVFRDIGIPVAEAERELLKADLAFVIHTILEKRKLTRSKAGNMLGIDLSDVSRLKNGNFGCFSVERMFTFLNSLNYNVEIHITPSGENGVHQRVIAV